MKRNKDTQQTIEQQVAGAILQRPQEIAIGKHAYRYPRPTLGTLILVSEEISKLPDVHFDENGSIVVETLKHARKYKGLYRVISTLLLGSKRLAHSHNIFHNLRTRRTQRRLERGIADELSPSEAKALLVGLLEQIECADFFAVTTFLQEISVTKPRRKVETKTTASGQPSAVSASGTE